MRRAMVGVDDLIEEAKVRTVWWALCIFAISYFLTHTSKSMWTNVPMSILILAFLRYLSFKVEFHWRGQPVQKQTHLSQLSKRQLSAHDHRLSTVAPVSRWRRKVGSPSVEAAFESFIENILRDFVVDLWYSSITPDREAPELIRGLILHALGEISGRVKEMNLVDLLTRDMADLIGHHLDIFRKNQSQIGVDVMGTLSSEERDERLKQHLIVSQELHPALLSSEHEYKYGSNDIKLNEAYSGFDAQASQQIEKPTRAYSDSSNMSSLNTFEDPAGIPPEWTPTNVSVHLLNLVDKVFQLKRRGWIRKQVLWISKQILQLVMEDAIDEWILRQINWLRRDEVIVQGIRWIQDTLWPNGVFFTRLDGYQGNAGPSQFDKHPSGSANQASGNRKDSASSFEQQLEASRNASEVKKLLLGGTPPTLVSIIGYKQYQRSARDIYYFLQSNVCVKQLAYAMIEQVLVSLFPELRQLIEDIHEKGRKEQASFTYQL
uniref:PXA domain-containing protein n=1 Tax=Oryza nivara TaxID=4536 RepID=A0A0E0IYI2_ORYNI